jgi:hypothetical protein
MKEAQRTALIAMFSVLFVAFWGGCTGGGNSLTEEDRESRPQGPGNAGREEGSTQVELKKKGAGQRAAMLDQYEERHPSLVQMLANLEHYHGKEVLVEGYLVVEFEGTAIYLSKDDADFMITRNGFWVSFENNTLDMRLAEIAERFNCRYVLLEGTFDAGNLGHLRGWQGAICKVSRLQALTRMQHETSATDLKEMASRNEATGRAPDKESQHRLPSSNSGGPLEYSRPGTDKTDKEHR